MPPRADLPSQGPILILGATGRVGGAVLAGLEGRVTCRPAYTGTAPAGNNHRWVRLDLLDSATFAGALRGVSAIFVMRPPQIARASLIEPFLVAARQAGINRLVFLSVKGADSNRLLPHHGMERLIERLGFDWTHIRPSDFMQNLETEHLTSIMERNEIAVPAGTGRSAFIDVADVGAAVVHCLLTEVHSRKGYTLTGPQALNFAEIAATLSEVTGRSIRYRHVSLVRFVVEHRRQSMPLGLCLIMAALYTVQRLGLAAGQTNTTRQLLGRDPGKFADYASRRFGAGSSVKR